MNIIGKIKSLFINKKEIDDDFINSLDFDNWDNSQLYPDECPLDSVLKTKIDVLLSRHKEKAVERKGGAYTTTFCVVGDDMETGIWHAENVIDDFVCKPDTSPEDQCEELYQMLERAGERYSGRDSEGYVVGTIRQVAFDVRNLLKEGSS